MQLKKRSILLCLALITCFLFETVAAGYMTVYADEIKTSLKTAQLTIRVKEKAQIVINNKNAEAVYTYKSSNSKVAAVNELGRVTGKKAGFAWVTVSEIYNKENTVIGTVQMKVRPVLDKANMLKNSLLSTGNNYRIKKVIEKAKNGGNVTVAYIGGSITEGFYAGSSKDFAYLSYQYFKNTFGKGDKSNVKFVNAGMAGTPSSIGMIRYERDVVARAGSAPDIVFIEFAVNDSNDMTNGDAYESLVRNVLNAENKPAVVLLFSVFKTKWNLQSRLQPIGNYYNLPMISIKNAIVPELKSGALTNDEFFADDWHPSDAGHKIMADCISYYFDTVDKETKAEADITIPDKAKIGKSFEGIKMINAKSSDEGITIKKGGFSGEDTVLGSFRYDYSMKTFPGNWKHSASSGDKSFIMTLECKNLVIVYKMGSNTGAGKADVYVDGDKTQTYDSYSADAWNNPVARVVFNNTVSEKHTIEIRMAEDSSRKKFVIFAFGYTK